MRALKTYLAGGFKDSPEKSGRVHSIFERAANIAFGRTMITVLDNADAEIPDSVLLARGDFAKFAASICAGAPAFAGGGAIASGGARIDIAGVPNADNFFGAIPPFDKSAAAKKFAEFGFYHVLPERAEAALKRAAEALAQNDAASAAKEAAKTIGFGAGLTPAADDAILGIEAFLEAVGSPCARPFAEAACAAAQGRTTDASLKYLRCAAQGRFALPLVRAVKSLAGAEGAIDYGALSIVLAAGHSSGKDTMRGVKIMAENLLNL